MMKTSGKATIKDVAKLANVSVATVSHVINNTRFVSDEVQQRVRGAMYETGYVPNYIAKALRSGRTKTIGIIIPDISNPYFSSVVYSMEDSLRSAGYMMILCDSSEDSGREQELIDHLCANQVDGIILAPVNTEYDYTGFFERHGVPAVFFDRNLNVNDCSGVFCNVREASAEAVDRMIRRGHRRVALINRNTSNKYSIVRERLDGYLDALKQNDIAVDPQLIYEIPATSANGYAAMTDILTQRPDVNGVYVSNQKLSIGAFECLMDHKVRIPQDMSIVAYSTHIWHNMTTPRLASVLEPLVEIGKTAVRLMIDKLNDPDKPAELVRLKAYLEGEESI